jgi:hypothetical protein
MQGKITAKEFKKYLDFAYSAYQENNITNPDQTYRQDGKVPYMMHPLWCASMLITDTQIPWEQREIGFKALILHDVLEDTSLELPDWVELEVRDAVKAMTFDSQVQALRAYKSKSPFIKLLMLYDELSTMYEDHVGVNNGIVLKKIKKKMWKEFVIKGIAEVEKEYGNIRIVQVGKAIVENTKW